MSEFGPEFDSFAKRVREELIPKIEGTSLFVSITPQSKDKVDVKFAVELGLAIMYDKPILAVIQPGTHIPEKLSKVVDRFVECDLTKPSERDRLAQTLKEIVKEMSEEE